MMNTKTLPIGSALLAITLAACGQPTSAPQNPVVGTWTGTYNGSSDYAMIIKADGTVTVYDGLIGAGSPGSGTWTYDGTTYKSTYGYGSGGSAPLFSVAATMTTPNRLSGTWGSETNTTNGGTFSLDRQ